MPKVLNTGPSTLARFRIVGDGGVVATTFALTLIVVVGITAAMALERCSRRARQLPEQSDTPVSRDVTVINLRVVAVDVDSCCFVVDGVINDIAHPMGAAGWPLTLRFSRPKSALLDAHASALIAHWAAKDQIVRFSISGVAPRRHVSVAYGASSLQFDLDDLADAA